MQKASPVSISCQLLGSCFQLPLYLRKKVLHGALTNGCDWIFLLIINLNDDYDGGFYKQSDMVQLRTMKSFDGWLVIPGPWPDLITAILLHWVHLMLICIIELLIDWY